MSNEAIAIVVSVLLAFLGYAVTFWLQRNQADRQAQLDRVNLQLRNLYGPLYSTLLANQTIWEAFCRHHWPTHGQSSYFGGGETTEEENECWRRWMIEVFEPLNKRIENVLLENGDLLEGDQLPKAFVDALAHIAAYRALYPKWAEGDFSLHHSVINFPSNLLGQVEPIYKQLLAKQQKLLGQQSVRFKRR